MDTVKIEKNDKKTSTYLDLLPAIYQRPENNAAFLSDFLLIFEQILTGINDKELKGIGEKLERVFELFYPYSDLMNRPDPLNPNCLTNSLLPYFSPTVDDVLYWMAHCLAVELPENWELAKKKKLLLKIISIFRKRGTKKGLEEYLSICLDGSQFVRISDDYDCREQKTCDDYQQTSFQPNKVVNPPSFRPLKPYYFIVEVTILTYCLEQLREQIDIIKKIIDTEKPEHTNYQFIVKIPIMQIGINSTVGVNTFLGAKPMQLGKHSTVGVSTLLWGALTPEYVFDSNLDQWQKKQPQFLPNINYDTWKELPMQIGVRSTVGENTQISKIPYKDFILYKGGEIILCM
jgi:hypothetical protein